MTQDLELRNRYIIVVITPDGKEKAHYFPAGSTSGTTVTISAESAGVKLTPAQYNFFVNCLNQIENYGQTQEKEEVTVNHEITAEFDLTFIKLRAIREMKTEK